MNGNMTGEVARQRIADLHRAARRADQAREVRAAARSRRARKEAAETIVIPVIPDFAEEMFAEQTGGRHARAGH